MVADSQSELAQILTGITQQPGVYKMLDANAEVIYVGKALNLKKRIGNYFQKQHPDAKTRALVSHIRNIETIVTHTESEALLLENNLIKSLRPRYNVLYRDDKSYPFIYLSTEDDFPRLTFHRGAQTGKGRYFGPYPSASAVRATLQLLQKIFPIRQCEDSFYKNRTRPCLQYQIKRCTAPCVELISKEHYQEDVLHTIMFLEGHSQDVLQDLMKRMTDASSRMEYERAARYRDQITSLRHVQEKQYITQESGDCDIIAAATEKGIGCVLVFTIRDGRNLGNKTFFPQMNPDDSQHDILEAFLPQYYLRSDNRLSRDIPSLILLSNDCKETNILQDILTDLSQRRVTITSKVRGQRAKWLKMAVQNAQLQVRTRLASRSTIAQRFNELQTALELDETPQRIECFDISHTMGEATVASCVVFNQEGPISANYRRYNITHITAGDDYAAMEQALLRRYSKTDQKNAVLPDILLIDGGKGQLQRARDVMNELQIAYISLLAIAKGPERRPGMETLFLYRCLSDQFHEIILPPDSAALHLLQQIRDEAHRFAISGHRNRRQKARTKSILEEIPGLGPQRRQVLLRHFGGLQEITRAGVDDLCSVPGINKALAQRIYDTFHGND